MISIKFCNSQQRKQHRTGASHLAQQRASVSHETGMRTAHSRKQWNKKEPQASPHSLQVQRPLFENKMVPSRSDVTHLPQHLQDRVRQDLTSYVSNLNRRKAILVKNSPPRAPIPPTLTTVPPHLNRKMQQVARLKEKTPNLILFVNRLLNDRQKKPGSHNFSSRCMHSWAHTHAFHCQQMRTVSGLVNSLKFRRSHQKGAKTAFLNVIMSSIGPAQTYSRSSSITCLLPRSPASTPQIVVRAFNDLDEDSFRDKATKWLTLLVYFMMVGVFAWVVTIKLYFPGIRFD